ncbi:universal stress protein family protein [Klebsormidium nitens]|uniref:Universal stress protein family protein n=1 Tax=Klebsormidium nitens TaxID=105231 RepID=A0A1Y1I5H0_KLENI|nr:universal stress protein family protein [Klebsormidium nitens]|eukprot:GAQ83967.1 universal stress protein family protein [Klebsormidium nitens]
MADSETTPAKQAEIEAAPFDKPLLSPGGARQLLCAVDGSEGSKAAFRFVLEKMTLPERGDRIILFQACRRVDRELVEPGTHSYQTRDFFTADLGFIDDGHRKSAQAERERQALKQLGELVKLADVPCETVVVTGDPRDEIPRYVAKHPVDIVVVGSRGLGTVKRLFLGSVSCDLVRHLSVPVIVVPPPSAAKAVN